MHCELFYTTTHLKLISVGGIWKRMQLCSKRSQQSSHTVAATVSVPGSSFSNKPRLHSFTVMIIKKTACVEAAHPLM